MAGKAAAEELITTGASMEIRLLGEVELRTTSRLLDVGAPRPQVVLAALAVDAGRPVAIETLIDRVWDDNPPAEVRNVLYSHVSRIRRLLKQADALAGGTPVTVERRHAGYVLDIDPDLVDLHRFRRLVDQGNDPRCGDDARAAALAEALDLWRGPPMAGLPGKWAGQVRDSWDRRRLAAVVEWARLELRLGRPAAVITTLPDLATEYPLVEPFETLLMRALYAAGRSAEALDRYTVVRQRLADELGTDPGPELRALHRAILHGELPPPSPDPVATAGQVPDHTAEKPPRPETPRHIVGTPTKSTSVRRRILMAALQAIVVLTAIGSVPALRQGTGTPTVSPSIERAQTLFAAARQFHHEGKAADAQAVVVDAVRLYDELITQNPGRNAPLLAPTIVQALRNVGIDTSVEESALHTWLADPVFTPYPAISQKLLLLGWRLKAPVYLDVIVWNYEQVSGPTAPRDVADVEPDVLKAAILEGSNSRHGTQVTDFEQLLEP